MTDRDTAPRVLAALGRMPIVGTAVLVGSSGLFGVEMQIQALTEDVDIAIPEPLAAAQGDAIVAALAAA